ncbi:hypothetical protein MYX84_12015 [Acidobacteria bacterium AH-259-O06]|nr:hypothetical protein [Acidobacteria bacterium AH-259-O06]
MSDSIFEKFEAVFLELLPKEINLPYTRESWKKEKQRWEKERDKLIQEEGRKDLSGKEFPQGSSYEEFVDFYYYKRDKLCKVVQFYWDKGDPDEKELIEQLKVHKVIPKHVGKLAHYWGSDWEEKLLKATVACFYPVMTKLRIETHTEEQMPPSEEVGARQTAPQIGEKHKYTEKNLVPICIVVACDRDGIRGRRLAHKLEKGAKTYYKNYCRSNHKNPVRWHRNDPGGFESHLSRLRKKAENAKYKVGGHLMCDSIRESYHINF